ncbi:hypothetical protein [Acinetobacter sp. WZC-1]|uniref:hypothetical protein n=1 Tax=Acinetobacter sp. WZC-1 TaxID=3459034 RepID=UPI00403E0CA4
MTGRYTRSVYYDATALSVLVRHLQQQQRSLKYCFTTLHAESVYFKIRRCFSVALIPRMSYNNISS